MCVWVCVGVGGCALLTNTSVIGCKCVGMANSVDLVR